MTTPSQTEHPETPFMTMKVVARLTLSSVKTIREEISRQRLRAYRIGHKILIKREDFETYLRGREIPASKDELALGRPSHLNAKSAPQGDLGMCILGGPLGQHEDEGQVPSEGGN